MVRYRQDFLIHKRGKACYMVSDEVLFAVDATTEIKVALRQAGTPIGLNDTAIAGHAIAAGAVLVTNNVREFGRGPGLTLEDWVN